jgi:hypothetical protein
VSVFIIVVVFAALVLAVSLQVLAASGHFPRTPVLAASPGFVPLYGSIAIALICLAVGVICAITLVPWYAIVIGGGLALLAAPLALQQCPDRFVDGSVALIGFAAVSAALALLMLFIATHAGAP